MNAGEWMDDVRLSGVINRPTHERRTMSYTVGDERGPAVLDTSKTAREGSVQEAYLRLEKRAAEAEHLADRLRERFGAVVINRPEPCKPAGEAPCPPRSELGSALTKLVDRFGGSLKSISDIIENCDL